MTGLNIKANRLLASALLFGLAVSISPTVVVAGLTDNATWTGGGGSSTNWNTEANWANGNKPDGIGNSFVHFAGMTSLTPYNDYGALTQFKQILFDSGAGSFTLNGRGIKLFSNANGPAKIENNSASPQTVNLITDDSRILAESEIELNPTSGDLTINSSVFADTGNGVINVYGNAGRTLTINGTIGQYNATVGSLINRANNTVVLTNTNTYTGGTTLNGGKLLANGGGVSDSATGSGAVTINGGATLAGTGRAAGPVSVNSGATITAGSGATAGDSVESLDTGNQTWSGGGKYAVKFNANAGAAGTNSDLLNMGTLSIGNGFQLTLLKTTVGSFAIGTPATYQIATTGTITTDAAGATAFDPAVAAGTASANQNLTSLFVLNSDALANIDESHFKVYSGSGGTGLMLQYDGGGVEPAPEPTSAVLAGLAGAAVLGRRRKR